MFDALKATAGGGGRGMRLAKERDEFVKLLQVWFYILQPTLINIIWKSVFKV